MSSIKLTIAIPIFNTAPYLKETFLCIENQSLGLENMEVILINDGSTDSSSNICRDFQKRHTKNVYYIEFNENYGVSHARNTALDMARGKYITFWDSDDLWSLNAMESACAFLDEYKDDIDMVSANIEFFDNNTGPHILNFEITKNEIIDTRLEYHKIRSVGPVSIMKTEIARLYSFDESQSCWEDTKYLNQILLRRQKYGMLSGVIYYYRRRQTNNSASQSYTKNKNYYLHDLQALYDGLYSESIKQWGKLVPMIQYLFAYALAYRFSEPVIILNEEERCQYEQILKKILLHIEDNYLKEIPNANTLIQWKMFALKYGMEIQKEIDEWREKEEKNIWQQICLARTKANYNILKKWFALKQQGKEIQSYFEINEFRRIAIYGLSDLGVYLIEELKGSPIQIVYGIDRRAEKLEFYFPVYTSEDTLPPVDAIVVSAVYFFKEIDMLLQKKAACPVISLEDVLYTIE